MKYFQALNDNKIVSIDDEYRYLFYIGTLYLGNGANNPSAVPYRRDQLATGWKVYLKILNFDKLESWMYLQNSPFMSQGSCPRYMCFLKQVDPNKVYGIRFKKPSSVPKIYVRMTYSALGNAVSGNSSICTLFVEVLSSDASTNINSAGAYLDYFDIVVLANDKDSIPLCNSGVEVRNQAGEVIWNSNCKMVNVVGTYNNVIAGDYRVTGYTTDHILVPTKCHKSSRAWDNSGSEEWIHTAQYKDFFTYDGSNLISLLATIKGDGGGTGKDAGMWDIRDFGCDPNKYISGVIAKI